jgi:hypothetical protein
MCDKTSTEERYRRFAKENLNSMCKKHGVGHLKTAQKLGFRRAGNVLFGISKEDCTVNVVRYGSKILQYLLS